MELEEEKTLKDYLQVARRRKYTIIVPMLVLLLISVVVAIALPPVYRSKATILIEQQHIPSDLVKSTVISFADERIQQIEQKLMTIDNLNKIIEKFGLYPNEKKLLTSSDLAAQFKASTTLELINADVVGKGKSSKATLAFTLSFDHKVGSTAQKVANELVTLFLDENIRSRTERAEESTKFLQEEAEKFKVEIQKSENQIAQYKEKYSSSLPELLTVNMSSIARIENTLQQLQLQEKMLEERRISLGLQISATSPVVVDGGDGKNAKVESRASIEAEYHSLLKKYSSTHPDVKALKRKIEGYEEQKNDKSTNSQANINNPVYLQLQSEINVAGVEQKNIGQQKIALTEQLKKLEVNVSQTHQVERGYYDLMRDLDNQKAKYKELIAKSLEAKLSQNLEVEQKAEKFSLLEPPRVPEKPEKPNRIKILFVGFLFSIIGGLGAGFVAEAMDNSIRNHNVLTHLTGAEPLVVIPYIENQEDLNKTRRNKINFAILILLLLAGATVAIHFFYMPLDVVFNRVSDRLSTLL
ncbi:Wzz/FepE/Etk N-terminal domain-containing protein [Methyloglobulus sp.]|uniref:Wzz/FepE/Etk N-terminal domain-containing protein n=1 Tax=Methyloglobulus sp. TaxID=2518622 RepID=UPI0032B77170